MTIPMRILVCGGGGLTFGTLIGVLGNGGNPNWWYIACTYIGLIALVILAHLRKWE